MALTGPCSRHYHVHFCIFVQHLPKEKENPELTRVYLSPTISSQEYLNDEAQKKKKMDQIALVLLTVIC